MRINFQVLFLAMDEVTELRQKLAAALEASYAQDVALEETVNAKNLEIVNLINSRNAEVAMLNEVIRDYQLKEAHWFNTQQQLQISENTVTDLTDLLEAARSQVQADLHSISEYSIECPKCRNRSPSASPVASQPLRVKELEDALLTLEGDVATAKRERDNARKISAKLEQEKLQVEAELEEARKSADTAMEIRKVLEKPLTGSDAEISAENARRVAAALVAYCQQLTVQLRSFRKNEKRAPRSDRMRPEPRAEPRAEPRVEPRIVGGWGEPVVMPSRSTPKAKKDDDDLFSMLQ